MVRFWINSKSSFRKFEATQVKLRQNEKLFNQVRKIEEILCQIDKIEHKLRKFKKF